jgi:serine protease Do
VITELDGQPVADAGQLQMVVGQKRPGDTIHLAIMRDSKPTSIAVTVEALNGGKGSETANGEHGKGRWGLRLADLTPDVRDQLQGQVPNSVQGAVVEDVQPGSPADNAGLQRGDVIMEVNRYPAKTASEVVQALSGVPGGQDALVLVWSNGGSTFRVLHPSEG